MLSPTALGSNIPLRRTVYLNVKQRSSTLNDYLTSKSMEQVHTTTACRVHYEYNLQKEYDTVSTVSVDDCNDVKLNQAAKTLEWERTTSHCPKPKYIYDVTKDRDLTSGAHAAYSVSRNCLGGL